MLDVLVEVMFPCAGRVGVASLVGVLGLALKSELETPSVACV